jgi:hypothetical protein
MSLAAIGAAFDAKMQAFPGGLDVAWEDVTYTPTAARPYLAVSLSAYAGTPLGIGADAARSEQGSYSINVNWPSGQGRGAAAAVADQLCSFFARGLILPLAAGGVIVTNSSARPAIDNGAWLTVPVTVSWIANA